MKKRNQFILKTVATTAIVLLTFKAVTFAEAFGPVGHAMHTMSSSFECISGELAFLCDFDDSKTPEAAAKNKQLLLQDAQDFATAAQEARKGLVQAHAQEPDKVQSLNTLFDSLDTAAARMTTAISNDDTEGLNAAVADVQAIRADGHKQFTNPRIKFNRISN
jgi:hypothetical protein